MKPWFGVGSKGSGSNAAKSRAERFFCEQLAKGKKMSVGDIMNKITKADLGLKKQVFVGHNKRAIKWFESSEIFTVSGTIHFPFVEITGGKCSIDSFFSLSQFLAFCGAHCSLMLWTTAGVATSASTLVSLELLANVDVQMLVGPMDDPKLELRSLSSFSATSGNLRSCVVMFRWFRG